MLLSCIILIKDKIEKQKEEIKHKIQDKEKIDESSNEIKPTGSLVNDLNLIYREQYENEFSEKSKYIIFATIILYVSLEQLKIIFKKFFIHLDFWMVELYILSLLNLKIFKIQIYSHQKLAFAINFISVILNIVTVIFTYNEKNEKKAIYIKYWWTVFIGIFVYLLYSFFYHLLLLI